MKKILFSFYILLFTLFLAGCGPQKQTGTAQTGGQTGGQVEEKKTVFDSIKDAMSKSLSLQCDYSSDNVKSTVYIKGKSLRSETDNQGSKIYAILKDNKLWTWSDKDKNGIIMDLTATQSQTNPQGGQKSGDDIVNEVEKYKQNCKQTVVSDSMFNPPSDINFQDLSQMFKNLGATVKP